MKRLTLPHLRVLAIGASLACGACGTPAESDDAEGRIYRVGPGQEFTDLRDVAYRLAPGDTVEVSGGTTYPGGVVFSVAGTADRKITVRGVRSASGARPILEGASDTVYLAADHFVLEGFDIRGGDFRCVFHQADDVTVRDTVVHDCKGHGILGADDGAGSLTLEYVEVYATGEGDTRHPIYAASDEKGHPGSTFRMQHCWVHDNHGGNSVKSRAERNEIFYNRIENGKYFELDLIGPEKSPTSLAREDSDIVGNVFAKKEDSGVAHLGGDGTGQTFGRYRFAYNTFVLAEGGSSAAIQLQEGIDGLELHDNVFHRPGGGAGLALLEEDEVQWAKGPALAGARNWVVAGTSAPPSWTETDSGADPGFVDASAGDFRPRSGSALIDRGATTAAAAPGHDFPAPLAVPAYEPPRAGAIDLPARARKVAGAIDLGAFEAE